MTILSATVAAFGTFQLAPALFGLAVAILELERWWTRSRRRQGASPAPVAYILDGLFVLSLLALALDLFLATVALLGAALDWISYEASTNPWALIGAAIGALALLGGMALARFRRADLPATAAGEQPAARLSPALAAAHADNLAAAQGGAESVAGDIGDAQAIIEPVIAPPPITADRSELLDEEPIIAVAMLKQRSKYVAAPQPQSFLDLAPAEMPAPAPERRRRSPAAPLAIMALIGLVLAAGGLLFRERIAAAVTGAADRSTAMVAPAALAAPTVRSAGATAIPAPTAASALATKKVKTDTLNVRAAPGTDNEVVIVLQKGAEVTVLSDQQLVQDSLWVKIRAGGREGWVSEKFLE